MEPARTALGIARAPIGRRIDLAVLVTDGAAIRAFGPTLTYAGSGDLIAAVDEFLRETGLTPAELDVVGLIGAGDAAALAARLDRPVVADFQVSDGGIGGIPLSVYHAALADQSELVLPVAIVTLDAVTSVTVIGSGGVKDLVAFEAGPGMAVLSDAAPGTVDDDVLNTLLADDFFDELPPRRWGERPFDAAALMHLPAAARAATAAAFVGETVALGLDLLAEPPAHLVLAGEGARLPAVADAMATATRLPVALADEHHWSDAALTAQAAAFLAVRRLAELPAHFPATSGVSVPGLAGTVIRPAKG